MTDDKIQRMQQLIRELNEASDAYYNGQAERMTDYEWDARFDELRLLEQETGTNLPDSPTQKVSEDSITGQKEEHEFAALSLAKTKQTSELIKWAEQKPIWISWKLDGLTLVATYDAGKLTKVVTRGNGHIGTNITHLSSAIANKVLEKGYDVYYNSAVGMISDFEYRRFGNGLAEEGDGTRRYTECDLLLVDDLGTEVVNQFTLSCLYYIISTRLNLQKPTIISTNLSSAELLKTYNDRIVSRLMGEYLLFPFLGTDIRKQKLQEK